MGAAEGGTSRIISMTTIVARFNPKYWKLIRVSRKVKAKGKRGRKMIRRRRRTAS